MDSIYIFYVLLVVVACLYAAVGHGGASGYLALMAIFSMSPVVMKPTALLLNLFVSLTAFIQFYRAGHFKWQLFLPLALASVPMAFAGGLITIEAGIYKKILGVLLFIPSVRFLFFSYVTVQQLRPFHGAGAAAIGGIIGFLSGLIGIGGGIILSPVLLLLKWTDQKQTAAVSALFIFVNSLAGLFGQFTNGVTFSSNMILFVCLAFSGGLVGAWLGAIRFNQTVLKFTLSAVLLLAAFKLLFTSA